MPVELEEVDVEAYHQWSGTANVVATEGQQFKAETSPGGEELFENIPEVPAGKIHTIRVQIIITEKNV